MARAGFVKCKKCGKEIKRDSAYKEKDRVYFCDLDCRNKYYSSTEGYEDKIYSIILPYYNNIGKECFWALRNQLRKTVSENGWKMSGVYMTIKYYIDVLEKTYNPKYYLGQIFPYYDEAKQYYANKAMMKNILSNYSDDYWEDENQIIVVHQNDSKKEKINNEIENFFLTF